MSSDPEAEDLSALRSAHEQRAEKEREREKVVREKEMESVAGEREALEKNIEKMKPKKQVSIYPLTTFFSILTSFDYFPSFRRSIDCPSTVHWGPLFFRPFLICLKSTKLIQTHFAMSRW